MYLDIHSHEINVYLLCRANSMVVGGKQQKGQNSNQVEGQSHAATQTNIMFFQTACKWRHNITKLHNVSVMQIHVKLPQTTTAMITAFVSFWTPMKKHIDFPLEHCSQRSLLNGIHHQCSISSIKNSYCSICGHEFNMDLCGCSNHQPNSTIAAAGHGVY